MKRNLIIFIATSFVALLLIGCGSSGKKVSTTKPVVTATATATPTATPTPTATATPDSNSSETNSSTGDSGNPLPF